MTTQAPAKLRALLALNRSIDELIEAALRERRPLREALDSVLPKLCEDTGARTAFVRTFSEDLKLATFRYPEGESIPDEERLIERAGETHQERVIEEMGGDLLVAQPLMVAGEWFGCAGFVVARDHTMSQDPEHLGELLDVVCEQLDDFLFAIRAAREKHRVLMRISDAIQHVVLADAFRGAVRAVCEGVPVARLLLVCASGESPNAAVHAQLYEKGELRLDTMGNLGATEDEPAIREEARALLDDSDRRLLDRIGFHGALEEVLIHGVVRRTVVGKVFVTHPQSSFNTVDRDLLSEFAGFVRQRVVDFNKEWRTLARAFRPEDVTRLLREDDYVSRYLAPREATVAMLYADISGFTRLCEKVLRTPSAVADLVETWSRRAVSLVWKHEGVFDKMVGDCIIALFGPPFYGLHPGERLHSAIRCALEIRDMTRAMPNTAGFEHLRDVGLGVATGVNLAPLFVGRFGPNDNFTGFSSGMNNAARLQGCAEGDEILVASQALDALPSGHGLTLSVERAARVKNVAEPLRFRAIL